MHEDSMGFNAVDELKLRIDEAMEIGEGVAVEAWVVGDRRRNFHLRPKFSILKK